MNVYNLLVFCFVLLLSDKALSNIKVPLKENDDVVQHSFAKLLKTIVKVNEERMLALEKITQLQDYMLTKNKLKTDEDSMAESMEEEDNRIVLAYAAPTGKEEQIRDIFKSNMTRNDFSNLLQSLIKLNEQRVGILKKLYRLEDYGVLSEVLRTGDNNRGDGNPNNLFLIVMSKNKTDPLLYIGFESADSVPSLDGNNKVPSLSSSSSEKPHTNTRNLDLIKDPSGFIQNIRKVIVSGIPNVHGLKEINIIDDEGKNNSNTEEPLNHLELYQRAEEKNDKLEFSKALKDMLNYKKQGKKNLLFEIINNKGRLNATRKLQKYDINNNNYSTAVNKYPELNFSFPFHNDVYPKSHDKDEAKHSSSIEIHTRTDYNNQFRKINSDSFIEKLFGNPSDSNVNKEGSKNEIIILKNNQNQEKSVENNLDIKYHKLKTDLARELEERLNGNMNRSWVNEPEPTVGIQFWNDQNLNLNNHNTRINKQEPTDGIQFWNDQNLNLNNHNTRINKQEPTDGIQFWNDQNLNLNNHNTRINKQEPTDGIQFWNDQNLNLNTHNTITNITESKPLEIIVKHKNILRNKKRHRNKSPSLSIMFNNETVNGSNLQEITKGSDRGFYSNKPFSNVTENSNRLPPIKAKPHNDPNVKELIIDKDYGAETKPATNNLIAPQFAFINNGSTNVERNKQRENNKQRVPNKKILDEHKNHKTALRNTYKKRINREAIKFCLKSCISAYKNVCRRLKCSRRAKRALRRECKRSCRKTFVIKHKSSSCSDESKQYYWFNPHLH